MSKVIESLPTQASSPANSDFPELTSASPETSQSFSQLKLDAPLARAVAEMGYTSMTPIQAQAIPVVLQGR
ncbi:MAG: hypothetical protein EB072_11005, partial [Betaproteobacteria bacterium]|nr:hypothetical protein [Betaproteobacteria bacterium]